MEYREFLFFSCTGTFQEGIRAEGQPCNITLRAKWDLSASFKDTDTEEGASMSDKLTILTRDQTNSHLGRGPFP